MISSLRWWPRWLIYKLIISYARETTDESLTLDQVFLLCRIFEVNFNTILI